eukprot:959843-Pyramimonas_sp.AAC.1
MFGHTPEHHHEEQQVEGGGAHREEDAVHARHLGKVFENLSRPSAPVLIEVGPGFKESFERPPTGQYNAST